jgi:hypothetical protein
MYKKILLHFMILAMVIVARFEKSRLFFNDHPQVNTRTFMREYFIIEV